MTGLAGEREPWGVDLAVVVVVVVVVVAVRRPPREREIRGSNQTPLPSAQPYQWLNKARFLVDTLPGACCYRVGGVAGWPGVSTVCLGAIASLSNPELASPRCVSARQIVSGDNNNSNRNQRRNSRFLTISSLRRELSPTRTLKWPGRNRVQNHVRRRALITCNMCCVLLGTKGQISY